MFQLVTIIHILEPMMMWKAKKLEKCFALSKLTIQLTDLYFEITKITLTSFFHRFMTHFFTNKILRKTPEISKKNSKKFSVNNFRSRNFSKIKFSHVFNFFYFYILIFRYNIYILSRFLISERLHFFFFYPKFSPKQTR